MGIAPFTLMLAFWVVVVVLLARMAKRLFDFREKQLDAQVGHTAEKAAQYAAQTERLEQRVRVLERIVTDRGIDVGAEIERLREQPLN